MCLTVPEVAVHSAAAARCDVNDGTADVRRAACDCDANDRFPSAHRKQEVGTFMKLVKPQHQATCVSEPSNMGNNQSTFKPGAVGSERGQKLLIPCALVCEALSETVWFY